MRDRYRRRRLRIRIRPRHRLLHHDGAQHRLPGRTWLRDGANRYHWRSIRATKRCHVDDQVQINVRAGGRAAQIGRPGWAHQASLTGQRVPEKRDRRGFVRVENV